VIAIGAVVLARRLRRSADYDDYDEDYEDYEDGDEVDRPGPGPGSEERR
jgi:hypothetical protein